MTLSNIILAIIVIAAVIVIVYASWRLLKLIWRLIKWPFWKLYLYVHTQGHYHGFDHGYDLGFEHGQWEAWEQQKKSKKKA